MRPRLSRRSLVGALPLLLARRAAASAGDVLQEWHDATRGRTVPVRIRLPDVAPAPVVIVSHGLGGSRDGLAYLGIALAEAGFVAVHLQHHGSDIGVWSGVGDPRIGLAASVLDPANARDRLLDVSFALDILPTLPALRGRLDMARPAIAGHSLGAWTVTHMLGERLPGSGWGVDLWRLALPDRRLAAGIALSPVPPLGFEQDPAYDRITAPILHMTGTRDRGIIEAARPEDRTIPFRQIAAPGVLVVLEGADHASFAGEAAAGPRWNDPTYQPRIAAIATLFLRGVRLRDAAALALLLRGAPLARADRIESKGHLTV